jgi:hypothetical protein
LPPFQVPTTSGLAQFSNLPYIDDGPNGPSTNQQNCLLVHPAVAPSATSTSGPMSVSIITRQVPKHALWALGVGVCSLYLVNPDVRDLAPPAGFADWSGTSFATAFISGNLAANNGALPATPVQIEPCTP